ncbi:hypothetical protein HZ994_09330 [Akkermansiaceae bacterium]|nr:hypothetical protein HZ994_09330 [Akkermansiaceae bacterium]
MFAFDDLDRESLDEDALEWVATIEQAMDTTGVTAVGEEGLWQAKAKRLTTDDLLDLSRAVDELAHWFARQDT